MAFKHKHDAVIRAYLEGKAVEWKYPEGTRWNREQLAEGRPHMLGFNVNVEYRIAPESRWLNVYEGTFNRAHLEWSDSREGADSRASTISLAVRIAVIEDKQDGTPWVLHQLEK